MLEKKGVIYILTNPSFENYVKIGYADDIEKRLKDLNRSECIPFAFRIYATYEVTSRLSDKKIHSIIDMLNPNLRSIEKSKDKDRVREFYAISPEDAYLIFKAMAEMHECSDKLKLHTPSLEEKEEENTAEDIELESKRKGNEPITLDEYLMKKEPKLVELYKELHHSIIDENPDTEVYVLPQYIGWRRRGTYFAEIHIQLKKISIQTLVPESEYSIGKRLPDSFLWTLNYRVEVISKTELKEAKDIILESYNRR